MDDNNYKAIIFTAYTKGSDGDSHYKATNCTSYTEGPDGRQSLAANIPFLQRPLVPDVRQSLEGYRRVQRTEDSR